MLPRGPAPVKNQGAPPILPGVKAAKPTRLAGPPLAGALGGVGAKVPVAPVKGTKVVATQTAHGTVAKAVPFRPLPGVPFSGAPALEHAYKDTPAEAEKPSKGGGILGTLEGIPGDVAGAVGGALKEVGAQRVQVGSIGATEGPSMAMFSPHETSLADVAKGTATAVKNLPGSTVRLATGAIPGVIDTGLAAGELAAGKPARAEAMGKGLAQIAEHPFQYAEKEPASALLMLGGAEAAAGTAAGDVARSGALGDRAAQLASTERPDLKLFNDEAIPREYSKDVIRKGAQVAADKFREARLSPDSPHVNQATGTRLNRHVYGGGLISSYLPKGEGGVPNAAQGLIKPGLVDKVQGNVMNVRKLYANDAAAKLAEIKKPLPKGAEEAVPLAVEGTIRTAETAKADLEGRLASLKTASDELTGTEKAQNAAQQAQITKLLGNKKLMADPQPVVDAAKQFADHQQELTERKVQLGALEPDQTHAKYVPYATQHMGADYNLDPGPHPLVSEIATLEKTAKGADREVALAQSARDHAAAPNPRVANTHPISLAQTQVRRAELETARAEGRSTDLRGPDGTRSPRFLNPAKLRGDAARARATLAKAKQDFLDEQTRWLTAAKAARDDTRGQLLKARENLAYMKSTGQVKNSGDMWPRLETGVDPDQLRALEADSVAKTMAHRAQLTKFSDVAREHAAGNVSDAEWEAEKARTDDTSEARDDGIARVQRAREAGARRPLTTDEIQAHARESLGDREVGFLTHKDTSWGAASHSRSGIRPAIERRSRTGLAYKTGTYDASWDALKRQAFKDAQDISGHEGRNEMIRRFGIGSYQTEEAAEKAAQQFSRTADGQRITKSLGPVEVVHAGPDQVLNRAIMPSAVATDTMKDFGLAEYKGINELRPEGKYRLMPSSVAKRINEHDALNGAGATRKLMQGLTNRWRNVALYTNPHWGAGVAQENMIRLAFAGVNPFAVIKVGAAVKVGDALAEHFRTIAADPAATEAQRFAARAQVAAIDSGTQYGGLVDAAVDRRALAPDQSALYQRATAAFDGSVVGPAVLKGWEGWKTWLGNRLHTMGDNTSRAMLGKIALTEAKGGHRLVPLRAALKDAKPFVSEWKQLITRQDRAVKAYAEGKLAPATAAKLGDDILKMAGNWHILTPTVRSVTQTIAPFDLWFLNSMKLIFQVLPVDHPFKSAALAAMEAGTASMRPAHPTAEYLEGGIGLKLPVVGNITWEVSKYSPFGIGVGAGQINENPALSIFGLPTIADPVQTLVGLNPLSHESEVASYDKPIPQGVRFTRALEDAAEELIPGIRPAEAILKKGGKENPYSVNPLATKPGTQKGILPALAKEFSPVPFIAGASTTGALTPPLAAPPPAPPPPPPPPPAPPTASTADVQRPAILGPLSPREKEEATGVFNARRAAPNLFPGPERLEAQPRQPTVRATARKQDHAFGPGVFKAHTPAEQQSSEEFRHALIEAFLTKPRSTGPGAEALRQQGMQGAGGRVSQGVDKGKPKGPQSIAPGPAPLLPHFTEKSRGLRRGEEMASDVRSVRRRAAARLV
jgi:hypothetical protein